MKNKLKGIGKQLLHKIKTLGPGGQFGQQAGLSEEEVTFTLSRRRRIADRTAGVRAALIQELV